jgi:hypothetical protein
LVFEKNANFFAENWQKSPKIAIITSTPGRPAAKAKRRSFYLQHRFGLFPVPLGISVPDEKNFSVVKVANDALVFPAAKLDDADRLEWNLNFFAILANFQRFCNFAILANFAIL